MLLNSVVSIFIDMHMIFVTIFVFLLLTYFTLHHSSSKKSLHVFKSTEPFLCMCLCVSIESGEGMVRVGTLVLFLISEEMFSVIHH